MPEPESPSSEGRRPLQNPGELEVGILFMDLVDSSVFASVLGLREYADLVEDFHRICMGQCRHFFGSFLEGTYQEGADYSARILGDELLVFLHTGRPHNDVYLLTCLAATIKSAWLAAPLNRERALKRQPVSQVSGGIHWGRVWATPVSGGYNFSGYAINMAKRIEGHSRAGCRYRILVSDHAFKQVHFRQRNLLFGPSLRFESKGLLGETIAYEVASTFIRLRPRLDPSLVDPVRSGLAEAVQITAQDLWMHDFHQTWSEAEAGCVTKEAMELCRAVLHHEPSDPVALYFFAQALRERSDLATAALVLRELTSAWPRFADGHWELARVLTLSGDEAGARLSMRVANMLGIEEPLP